jgi:hypothetical protein
MSKIGNYPKYVSHSQAKDNLRSCESNDPFTDTGVGQPDSEIEVSNLEQFSSISLPNET